MNKSLLALLLVFSAPVFAMDDGGKKGDDSASARARNIARILQGDPNVPTEVKVGGGVSGATLAFAAAYQSENIDTPGKVILSIAGAAGGKFLAEKLWSKWDQTQDDSDDSE